MSNEVLDFEMNHVQSLLNYSNVATGAPTFYNNDINGSGGTTVCIVDTGINDFHDHFAGKEIENWLELLKEIKPKQVMVYTIERDTQLITAT